MTSTSVLRCAYCLLPFNLNDRNPKLLDCFHTICLKCFESETVSNGMCPICEAFQKRITDNFMEKFIVEHLLLMCPIHRTMQAESFSTDLGTGYCSDCSPQTGNLVIRKNQMSDVFKTRLADLLERHQRSLPS